MALLPCPECKKDVSDEATACPHCGLPARKAASPAAAGPAPPTRHALAAGAVVFAVLVSGGAVALSLRHANYSRVEQLRAEQDAEGTTNAHVRQRFFRLYKKHPHDAMYIYLWSRCVEDAKQQLELAEEGIAADPSFSWNYNMAARALARQGRVRDAYDQAVKGAAKDPGNMQLADKLRSLKLILDRKLAEQGKPAPNAYTSFESKEHLEKGAVRYQGLFRSLIRAPDHADLRAVEKARLPDYKGPPLADALQGFVVCGNPYADACLRVYVPRDARFKAVWPEAGTSVAAVREHQLLTVAGAVVTNGKGENVMLADAVTVEAE